MRIENLADYLDLVETIALWHFQEWGRSDPKGSIASWAEGLRKRTNRDHIPATYIALDRDELLGSVTLVEHDMGSRLDLSPWLAGLYVKPTRRQQGVGSALVNHAVRSASLMGADRLYLYSESARAFYEKLGWQHITDDFYEGQTVSIMFIDITPAHLTK